MKKRKENLSFIINGLFWIVIGLLLIFTKQWFISRSAILIGSLLSYYGLYLLLMMFLPKNRQHGWKSFWLGIISAIAHILLGLWIGSRHQIFAAWFSMGIGLYQLIMGTVMLLNHYLLKKDNVPRRFHFLFFGIIHILWGISGLFMTDSIPETLTRLGVYLMFLGFTSLSDGRSFFISDTQEKKVKRKLRVSVPVIFVALSPRKTLEKINKFLQKELSIEEKETIHKENDTLEDTILKVFIHVGEDGFTNMGHVDLSYKGQIYAFGNYDVDSGRLFGSVGDGLLFSLDEQNYIEYCLEDGITMFEYRISLTDEQQREFEDQLVRIYEDVIEWIPTSDRQKESYIGVMYHRYDVHLYKFKQGRFKTYFVLGTNCVLLADQLIGASGLDILTIIGFLTPGAYYEYFEQELQKPHSIIVGKTIHHAVIDNYLVQPNNG